MASTIGVAAPRSALETGPIAKPKDQSGPWPGQYPEPGTVRHFPSPLEIDPVLIFADYRPSRY